MPRRHLSGFVETHASWFAAALLFLLAAQLLHGMTLLSVTSDELSHLPAGISYVQTGDLRLNPQHPPLAKWFAGLGAYLAGARVNINDPGWTAQPPDEWGFGGRNLWSQRDPDRVLFAGRLPLALLTLVLGAVVFLWSRSLWGPAGGLVSLTLLAFCPNVVAHGRFATMDLTLAAFFGMTLLAYRNWIARGGAWRATLLGAALGGALGAKFSGLVLVPCLVLLTAIDLIVRRAEFRSRIFGLLGVFVVAALVVHALYGFPGDPLAYLHGAGAVNADRTPGYWYYLAGEYRQGRFPLYFPIAFLVKTTIPALVAIALSLILVRWRRAAWIDEATLYVPVAAFVAATMIFADDLGVRYLLPVYPILYVGAGRLGPLAAASRPAAWTAAALAAWALVGAARIHPDQLAYFNEAAGGPANGWRWLDDSNLDWGENLKRLKGWMDDNGVAKVNLHYFGNALPEAYGIAYQPMTNRDLDAGRPAPGVWAVSTHLLIRGNLRAHYRGSKGDWLKRYEPIGRVGYSIYLYRF